ncbi:MAG: hypothetical protein ABR509_04935 [Candidatus Limnocylindria bacterium]
MKARIDATEVAVPEALRNGVRRRRFPKECYTRALDYVFDNPAATLVHGTYAPLEERPDIRTGHAWAELDDGDRRVAFDPNEQRFYDRESYYAALRLKADRRYSAPDAAKLAVATRHCGPWESWEVPEAGGGQRGGQNVG